MIIVLQNRFFVYFCHPERKKTIFTNTSENSSAGRARPCQGRGRGFESRFSLAKHICPGGGIGRHARLKILCPSGRAGSSPAPGTKRLQLS